MAIVAPANASSSAERAQKMLERMTLEEILRKDAEVKSPLPEEEEKYNSNDYW